MLLNEHTAICTNKVLLVPYCHHHVTTYHDWMKDPDIQAATASEPLSIVDEYAMQKSWRSDTDKLTFIVCMAPLNRAKLPNHVAEIASMIGDVNMFVSVHEEDDGSLSLVGELELMIATKEFQRRGLGRCALLTFLRYILQHETEIVHQYPNRSCTKTDVERFSYFIVKIKEDNMRSLSLFEGVGFQQTSATPSFFGEYELRHSNLTIDGVNSMLKKCGVQEYHEVKYTDSDSIQS